MTPDPALTYGLVQLAALLVTAWGIALGRAYLTPEAR